MDRGDFLLTVCLLCCCSCSLVRAISRAEMFPYGTISGDFILAEGDDETSRVLFLPKPFYFYSSLFPQLYVATNGIISAHDLPMEKQYVDDGFPTDFPVVAPFLADIDTSGGRGQIYYRVTETPSILNRIAKEVHQGFSGATFTPTHAVVVTWENVGAYEEKSRTSGPANKVNTFQAVIGYDETDSYVLFLYPEDGLNFFGTRPKESYNVEIELPARVGFSRGEITHLNFLRTEGPHYSVTSNEQSVKNLYQVGNTGVPGIWLFHTGNHYSFDNIVPASIGAVLATVTPGELDIPLDTTTPEYSEFEEYSDNIFNAENKEEDDYPLTGGHPEFYPPPVNEELPVSLQPGSPEHSSSHVVDSGHPATYDNEDVPLTLEPRYSLEPAERQSPPFNPTETLNLPVEGSQQPEVPLQIADVYPPQEHEQPLSPGGHVVSVDEEEVDFDTGVIQYTTENKETCARFQQQCSQNAFCSDYATGFCCHCHSGFYGNGRHCLPEGVPQRISGKVNGMVTVGLTPVVLNNIDLHAYIVVGDGRAYTAISEVPEPVGWALMPVAPIGELFGWLFALELPNSQVGFKITGAEFTRNAEVIFYPGNQRLSIIQTGHGLDDHNHLTIDTTLSGSVPFLPPGATVTMDPFKETYQYYPSVVTSTSVREFSIVSVDRGSESFSFQLKQNITYRHCRHDHHVMPETLQITVERVLVMYVTEERILRYAITNKISPVGELVNPCYVGIHDCDTTAQCIPLEGQAFRCQCAAGYRGDGHNCYDIDECAEGLASCGDHAHCVNMPGSHQCHCQTGFEFGYDGHICVDIDECISSPCSINGRCINDLGSYRCQCHPGFYGDGYYCSQQEEQTSRPKTQCEQQKESLQRAVEHGEEPSLGLFIPECDPDGRYRPLQCHSSSGHCWCVDSSGKERPRTQTPPGSPPVDCDSPERPKTQCEHHRDSLQTSSAEGDSVSGAFVPQCDAYGQYRPLQCNGSTGHCWCVDSRGQERPGTRTPPGALPTDCDQPDEPERPKSQCEHHRDSVQTGPDGYPLPGAYTPQCDADGQYRPLQCHSATGYCWCVDIRGQERAGTRTSPGTTPTDCDKPDEPEHPKTQCEHHRDSVPTTTPEGHPIAGVYVPHCDADGQYSPLQCHGSTGHCWCVDSRGQERAGTRTPPGTPPTVCDKPDKPERPKTHCEHHRDSIQTAGPEGHPLPGAYIPQCDANGQYLALQCHGSTGHCWCVDSSGQERAGTRTPPGTPHKDCDKPDKPVHPKTHCEQHRDSVQTTSPDGYPIREVFVPQCDADGQYTPQQCHGSTGYCWCVDNLGQERAGTRTPPGTPSKDCDKPDEPEHPKTDCEQHRDRAQTTIREGYPLTGVFVPQCDSNGQYLPQQCQGSTGYCWCVDSRGQEREGTRTPPGTPPTKCDKPDEPTHPKTHCELHRDSIQTTSPEGYPILGVFVPQCDADGHYTPQQCHGSTGQCWCVDSSGQERPGTRTLPGTPPEDCDKPDRPKTQCEHHRDSVQTTSPEGYPIFGAFVPECDSDGQYLPQQCHGSTGYCWCVDSRGQERAGTKTPPGTPPKDCDKPDEPERPKTHCEQHRDRAQATISEGYPVVGAFVPQCDSDGQYLPRQCHDSTGHCWCVDTRGQERTGTRTPPGTPPIDCDKPDRPKTQCEHHRDSVQTTSPEGYPIFGAFVPECDSDGQYLPQQCHGSTGYCWCVDSRGQERAGTKTPPGTPPKDCDKPERPKTHCEQHRDRGTSDISEGYPVVGAFVPQCDSDGQYLPRQCHDSTGHCWCVDTRGQERTGTRTPPGTPPIDCDKPVPVSPTERPESVCERWRASLIEHYGGKPEPQHYVPQCEPDGQFSAVQCYGESSYCWCVDQDGREVPGTRSYDVVKPACLPTVAPPTVHPMPRPDVTPPPSGITLLYAQGQKIGALPLNGTRLDAEQSKTLLALHGSIVVGIAYDCKENQVYWTDLSARTISRASILPGAEPELLINTNLISPEGLAVDVKRRLMFWVDSAPDVIEGANLDGSGRRTLFDTDLVNPRAIIVVPSTGTLYWTDWNREAPKIESSTIEGQDRRVVVSDGIGLPNALTYDSSSGQVCWADAGTKRLECIFPNGSGRRMIHGNLNYPFSMVYYNNHFYYTDWRRDGVIAVSKDSNQLTDEYLPDQRSHLYGITIATTHCL
ncbi:LOW QUALITY PROTEIN: nidogen-2 [Thalassophryne amazonica]|uniref:LOW QUALITY PROTEIN: nidogen-2 n=1 Tax=Thalassophryne amazonica TaxID=390379 RepID=UPI0014715799|nr:LOW QUALITY PROTEIN: nidogen-2 [Thalassophryne amazonica]